MKKIAPVLLSGLVALSMAACSVAKTSSEAPNSTAEQPTSVDKDTAETNQDDAVSEMRRKQLNSDIRSREQRNDIGGNELERADGDLASEVRSKLEANLPASALAVEAKDGVVTITGTTVDEAQLAKVESLAKEIKGVQTVQVNATVASSAKPAPPDPSTEAPIQDHTTAEQDQ
ncbi:BON domain-containing protein [Phormidium tenue FACHB-886]|nr:BON domain-containing protein [Phormidium tenue FACHB-886]